MNGRIVLRPSGPQAAFRSAFSARRSAKGRAGRRTPNAARRGFTLIELIVVIAIIGILAAIALNPMRQAPRRAKEAALKENLFTLRTCIDQFYADFQKYPASLDELVEKGYLRRIPIDPVTGQADWVTVEGEEEQTETGEFATPGIMDVQSASPDTGLDGSAYSEW